MFASLSNELPALVAVHGYWIVALLVGLESAGVPLPGEAALVAASIYAGSTGNLAVGGVIAAAAMGAVAGDNLGYTLGRTLGLPLLLRHGQRLGLTEPKVKLGRYLFNRYGSMLVFFGRFVALLRVLTAFLAGVNHMAWPRFFLFNLLGGVAWSGTFGLGGYVLGGQIHRLTGPIAVFGIALAVLVIAIARVMLHRQQVRLIAEAERAYPGPLT